MRREPSESPSKPFVVALVRCLEVSPRMVDVFGGRPRRRAGGTVSDVDGIGRAIRDRLNSAASATVLNSHTSPLIVALTDMPESVILSPSQIKRNYASGVWRVRF